MPLKTLVKLWYSLNWRIMVYGFTLYLYLMSLFNLGLLYCLEHGLIDDCRRLVLNIFSLTENVKIESFSYSRVIIAEGLNAIINAPLLYLAMKHLPYIPFKGFRLSYSSFWRAFLILGPASFSFYLVFYLAACTILKGEDQVLQMALAGLTYLIFIPYAFKNCIIPRVEPL